MSRLRPMTFMAGDDFLGDDDAGKDANVIINAGTTIPQGTPQGMQWWQGIKNRLAPMPWWMWLMIGYAVTRRPRGRR